MTQTTRLVASIEPAAVKLTDAVRLNLGKVADLINSKYSTITSLDHVVALLSVRFCSQPLPWFIYRGGNHVALHRTEGSERVLIVTEGQPLVVSWPDDVDYDGVTATEARQTPPVTAPEAAGAPTVVADLSLPAIKADHRDGIRGGYHPVGKDGRSAWVVEPEAARLAEQIESINFMHLTDLARLKYLMRAQFPGWVTETGPGYFTLARRHNTPAFIATQALTCAQACVEPGDTLQIAVNQGLREAVVLATLGTQYLVEYTMPKGTTALQLFTVGQPTGKSVSYKTVSRKWLEAIVAGGWDWRGAGQGGRGKRTEQSAKGALASLNLARLLKNK